VSLSVLVQPKSSRNRIAGLHDGALKICITAPPVEGKANKAVIATLAKIFSLPKTAISVKSGHANRSKRLILDQITLQDANKILTQALADLLPHP